MTVVLELRQHSSIIRRVTVRHDVVIGRGSDCNLRISAPQVSRCHCFLRVGGTGVFVTDLESCNGTWLNGQKTVPGKRYLIKDGMKLAVGPVCFVAHIFRAEQTGPTADSRHKEPRAQGGLSGEAVNAGVGDEMADEAIDSEEFVTFDGVPDDDEPDALQDFLRYNN